MTKILHVFGDDYAALAFERLVEEGETAAEELWKEAAGTSVSLAWSTDDDYFEYSAKEFGEVDPAFIEWVLYNQDEDGAEHRNFYVVEG